MSEVVVYVSRVSRVSRVYVVPVVSRYLSVGCSALRMESTIGHTLILPLYKCQEHVDRNLSNKAIVKW